MRSLLIMTFLLVPALASAQFNNSRAQSWDFSVAALYQAGNTSNGEGGSSFNTRNTWGFGFNVGYNFNDNFAIGADFDFLSPGYTATMVNENDPTDKRVIDHTASQFNGRLKAILNLMDGPLVPYVEAGFGWTYIDSNVADGPPTTGCWWHPWWGYICSNFYSTFSSTETSYGGALGVRYELRGNSFLKLSYNYWKIQAGTTDPTAESLRLDYGWRF